MDDPRERGGASFIFTRGLLLNNSECVLSNRDENEIPSAKRVPFQLDVYKIELRVWSFVRDVQISHDNIFMNKTQMFQLKTYSRFYRENV